jgi:hypothetical protein
MNNTNTVCLEPFKNLSIEFRNNKPAIAPCCIYPLAQAETVDFVNNANLVNIRQQWIDGTPPAGCKSCTEMESQGFPSRKQIAADKWAWNNTPIRPGDIPTVELTKMDYWVGDICNLACIMCGPNNSSLWKQELGVIKDEKKSIVNRAWKNLDLSHIEIIHLWGGEPFLSKEHVEFLQALPNKSKVTLYYTTNGTVQPSPELLEVWKECNQVDVYCSLDDIGPRYEYIRYPANWTQTVENFQWMINNCGENARYGINSTINVLSQYYVDEITDWFATNFKHDNLGRLIKHKLSSAFGPLSAASAHDIVIEHLGKIDQRRGTNWREVFPKAAEQIILPTNTK